MIWILGATGRIGWEIAVWVAVRGGMSVLVGRNAERFCKIVVEFGLDGVEVVETDDFAAEIGCCRLAVVVNTIGGYVDIVVSIVRACLFGGHYVDLVNDFVAMLWLLALYDEVVAGDSMFVTGVGFGVLGTEVVVVRLCVDRPTFWEVCVDALLWRTRRVGC